MDRPVFYFIFCFLLLWDEKSRSEEVIVPLKLVYRCTYPWLSCEYQSDTALFPVCTSRQVYMQVYIYRDVRSSKGKRGDSTRKILFQHPHTYQSTGVNGRVKMLTFPCTIRTDFVTTRHFIFLLSAAAALVYHIISNSCFILYSWRRSSSVIT